MQKPGEPVKIASIARRQKIPQKFLELILSGLKQGGFVESRRGAEGGYLLARPADVITVGEVLRYMEGGRNRKPARKQGEFAIRRSLERSRGFGDRYSGPPQFRRDRERLARAARQVRAKLGYLILTGRFDDF
jgi:hypothetical protein